MSFMSVRSWDTPGRWTTNYSGIAYSDDNGQSWTIAPTSVRTAAPGRAIVPYVAGNQNFQQAAFVKPPAGSAEAEAWMGLLVRHSLGPRRHGVPVTRPSRTRSSTRPSTSTGTGRHGSNNTPSAAKPILPGTTISFFGLFRRTSYPSVSEMSVQYNPYLNKYVMLYGDSSNNDRDADGGFTTGNVVGAEDIGVVVRRCPDSTRRTSTRGRARTTWPRQNSSTSTGTCRPGMITRCG